MTTITKLVSRTSDLMSRVEEFLIAATSDVSAGSGDALVF